VDGHRNLQPPRRRGDADLRKRRLRRVEILADGLANAKTRRNTVVDGAVQLRGGFFGHPECARTKCGIDVFRRTARECNLEVVNDTGAVHRDGRHEPALHQVDQDG
jgi:hypothetical protein